MQSRRAISFAPRATTVAFLAMVGAIVGVVVAAIVLVAA